MVEKVSLNYDRIVVKVKLEQHISQGSAAMISYSVRAMEMGDIPQVSQIEREAFPLPWPSTNFRRELMLSNVSHYFVAYAEMTGGGAGAPETKTVDCARTSGSKGSQIEMLRAGLRSLLRGRKAPSSHGHTILGFAGLWFMADEAHIANIAVREAYRHRGIGEHLLISAIDIAVERNARFVTLEVRASNEAAQALYRKYGFIDVGISRGYYTDNREDALLMTADRITSEPFQSNFHKLRQAHALKWGKKN